MPRYSAAGRSTGAGSTLLPLFAVAGASSPDRGCRVREIGIFNTTTTAAAFMVVRLTTAGTPGTALTEIAHSSDAPTSSCQVANTYGAGPTLSTALYQATLGAAAGAGVIWTFGDTGIEVPGGTANGLGVAVATGTGQVIDFYIVWDE